MNSITFEKTYMLEKERIRHALNGEVVCGEDDNGFIYKPASKEECDRLILNIYDGLVRSFMNSLASERAYLRLIEAIKKKEMTKDEEFQLFFRLNEEERRYTTNEYVYENDSEWKSDSF